MMRLLTICLILILLGNNAECQQINHVINGNFEYYTSCPPGYSYIDNCTGWRKYTTATSDFFHVCNLTTVHVPSNYFGSQPAANGSGYAGGYFYYLGHSSIYKEYIASAITPLTTGVKYEVSLSVSLSDLSTFGTNDIGVYFYDSGKYMISTTDVLKVLPQISFFNSPPITDTQGWVRLSQTFVADSAYDNIVIGGFLHYNALTKDTIKPVTGNGNYTYYYIDSVVVTPVDSFNIGYIDTLLCAGDTIDIPYYAVKSFASNNVFTAQLSDKNGSFSSPTNIGSVNTNVSGTIRCVIPSNVPIGTVYKIRIVASSPKDTTDPYYRNIRIGFGPRPAQPTLGSNSPLCYNDTLKLSATTSTSGVTWGWYGPSNFTSALQNPVIPDATPAASGLYQVLVTKNGCSSRDTISVSVAGPVAPDSFASGSQVGCVGDVLYLMMGNQGTNKNYTWTGPNGFLSTTRNTSKTMQSVADNGYYIATITTANGCSISDTVYAEVYAFPDSFITGSNSPVCLNDSLKLSVVSNNSNTIFTWQGPGPFSATGTNVARKISSFSDSGQYYLIADNNGCTAADTLSVTVKDLPNNQGFSAGFVTPSCEQDTLRLLSSNTSTGTTYSWTGPNSFSSNVQNPKLGNAQVGMGGDYIVTAVYKGCTQTDTVAAEVDPIPVFTATSNSPLCTGDDLQFSATSNMQGVSYGWGGPNLFSSTSPNPVLFGVWNIHSGKYYVAATRKGCSGYDTLQVNVKPLPAKPVASNNTPVCTGDSIQLSSVSSTSGVSYGWSGPGSFTSLSKDTTVYAANVNQSGDYVVTVMKDGCTSKDTTTVTVKQSPAAVTAKNNSPLCAGDSLEVTIGNSTTGVTYSWSGPNNFTDNQQNTGVGNTTTSATGWYVATLTLNGCVYKDSTLATIHPIPPTPVATASQPLCLGETLQLSSSGVTNATYSWTGPNNYNASTKTPDRSNMQYSDTGTYNVQVTVNGCTSPAGSTKVSLNPLPFVVITGSADTICQNDPVIFTAIPNNYGGTPQYHWYVNAQSIGTGITFNITTLNDGDIIRCDMTESTQCSVPYTDQSNDIKMNVLPWLAPSVTISADKTGPVKASEYITFTATAKDAGKKPGYQWKRNGKDVIGATGDTWSANTLNDNDTICVEVISNYKCPQPTTAMSNCIGVHILSSVGNITGRGSINLYPNPNNGVFTIKGNVSTNEPVQVTVVNSIGQVVYTGVLIPSQYQLDAQIELGGVARGLYLLKLDAGDEVTIIRFIKQ